MGCAEPGAIDVRIGSRDVERVRVMTSVDVRSARANCSVIVHDLSATGARIEMQSVRFERGDIVQLRLPFQPVEQRGEIAWIAGNGASVQFFAPLDTQTLRFLARAMKPAEVPGSLGPVAPAMAPSNQQEEYGEARRERAEVLIGASCRTESGRRGFVAMIDLTPEGCCLFGRDLSLSRRQRLTLQPECLTGIKATVQWSRGPLTGVLFDHALYAAVFSHLATTYPWPLPEPVKDALGPHGDLPDNVLRELVRMIDRAEAAYRQRDAQTDVMTTRPVVVGTRPGLAPRAPDQTLTRLFS